MSVENLVLILISLCLFLENLVNTIPSMCLFFYIISSNMLLQKILSSKVQTKHVKLTSSGHPTSFLVLFHI